VVAHRAAFDVELLHRLAQAAERVVVAELAGDEADALQQLLPRLLAERRAGVLTHRVVDDLREVLVLPVASREPDQREAGSRPRLARSYTAGMSFLRDRSPVTPKITSALGPAMRFRRRSSGSRNGLWSREISAVIEKTLLLRCFEQRQHI
jgi:hypothetical protein